MLLSFASLFIALLACLDLTHAFALPNIDYTDCIHAQAVPAALKARRAVSSNSTQQERATAVKDAFTAAFSSYFSWCKGHDELKPVSKQCSDSRNGWGASAVDALSTALVMQASPVVHEILEYIPTVDFTKTGSEVSLFETTIRYLGGMLSAYDLLKGPLSSLSNSTSSVDALLAQSRTLADRLKFAFDTPTGIPQNNLFFSNNQSDDSPTNGLATIGTLVLEWTRLSDLTNDPSYARLAQKAESYLLAPQPASNSPFPGLVGSNLDLTNGSFTDASGGWDGGDDSFYEYLLKMYVYDSSRFSPYRDRWILAANSTMAHLASHPSSRPDLTFLAEYATDDAGNTTLVQSSGHLACFAGGNFLLGGLTLSQPAYTQFGLSLVDGCHALYASTSSGIGPETFSWDSAHVPSSQADFYKKNGFYITDGIYDLRPEVLESYYYAWRITGDQKYREWGWDAFRAINSTCRVAASSSSSSSDTEKRDASGNPSSSGKDDGDGGGAFSSIQDVTSENGGGFLDLQESFFFAEVLQYAYLLQLDDPAEFQVGGATGKGKNGWVFNTEGHPIKVHGPTV